MAEHRGDEGLLDKILTLVAPPLPTSSQKGRGGGGGNKKNKASSSVSSAPTTPTVVPASSNATTINSSSSSSSSASGAVRHLGIQNHPYCDACGDGGNLLCCDTCPASFHFNCCDPPIDPKSIPSGDWLCRRCSAKFIGEGVPSLFHPLVEIATASNPLAFNIPYEMQRKDILPGSSRKELKLARPYYREEIKEQWKYCYACNKNSSRGRMVSCDFCPLIFHLDCLHPPLTTPPTTVWMCPVHPNSKIPGFDHPRLSQRLKALERSQGDVAHHQVKADFIKQLRKVPHYKRVTRHHNRRVTQVPPAIKSLYADPLPDASHIPSVNDSILTPGESVERWRMEEEMNRELFTAPRQPSLTHNQDEWTRRAILCQLCAPGSKNTSCTNTYKEPLSPSFDSSVMVAAEQLLELSAGKTLDRKNGPKNLLLESKPLPTSLNGLVKSFSLPLKNDKMDVGLMNGGDASCNGTKDVVCVTTGSTPGTRNTPDGSGSNSMCATTGGTPGTRNTPDGSESNSMCVTTGGTPGTRNTPDGSGSNSTGDTSGESGGILETIDEGNEVSKSNCNYPSVNMSSKGVEEATNGGHADDDDDDDDDGSPSVPSILSSDEDEMEDEDMDVGIENWKDIFVPDLYMLDPKVIQLLALQRIQQLLSDQVHRAEHHGVKPHPGDGGELKAVKHQEQVILNSWEKERTPPQKDFEKSKLFYDKNKLISGSLHTAPALLCPLSGTAFPFPLHRQVTSVGLGSEMDICLSNYGHCNYISSRQACIFYDEATQDYELMNYSEHGSVVDSVLYSCDFSDKLSTSLYHSFSSSSSSTNSDVLLTLDDITSLGKGRRAIQAKLRLESARQSLKDKESAIRAMEGALRLSAPVKDDFSLAEEMSKCEGLMTRTGLKRVAATENASGAVNNSNGHSSVVFSIPFSKTKKSDSTNASSKRGYSKGRALAKGALSRGSSQKTAGCKEDKSMANPPLTQRSENTSNKTPPVKNSSSNVVKMEWTKTSPSSKHQVTVSEAGSPLAPSHCYSLPCACKGSLSSVVDSSGKGWEGTATLFHGSRLRFGCLQFILSLEGRPGHSELLQALMDSEVEGGENNTG